MRAPFPLAFKLGDNSVMKAEKTVDLFLAIKGHKLPFHFLGVPKFPCELVISAHFLQRWKIKLDPVTEGLIIDEQALEIILGAGESSGGRNLNLDLWLPGSPRPTHGFVPTIPRQDVI